MHPNERVVEKLRALDRKDKEKLVIRIEQAACDNENVYHGCCRSVLHALQVHFGLENIAVVRAATALGGGVARTGEVCGALLAGLMAIGLVYASDSLDDSRTSPAYHETLERGARLSDRFNKKFGGLRCHDVQKILFGRHYDLRIPADVQQFRKSAHFTCENEVCRKAARMAAEVIMES